MLIPNPVVVPNEPLRPVFHFTAPSGWINDPNGLVYENGKYHLFYQHNPFGTDWGNMSWGHAISRDLIHWSHLPEALTPDALGTIFSGSAVIDDSNSAGFGKGALVCFYTAAGGTNAASGGKPFTQCLAWSRDGLSFTKFPGNPTVANLAEGNRDPKVCWHEASRQWVMALYLQGDQFALLGSKNLTSWTELSRLTLKDSSECPDFFEVPLDSNPNVRKWIFSAANGNYQVGSFDGQKFVPATPVILSHFGNTGYAAQTYSNAPKGRRIQISWFRDANFPGCAWNQQMSFPNDLALTSTPLGPRLTFQPVREIKKFRKKVSRDVEGNFPIDSGLLDVEGQWKVGKDTLRFEVNGVSIEVDPSKSELRALGQSAPLDLAAGNLDVRLLADRTSIEIYAQHGRVLMNLFALPKGGERRGVFFAGSKSWPGSVRAFEIRI